MTTVAGFVVLYTVIGAAGTGGTLDWPQRLAFWGIAAIICFPVCYSKSVLALYLVGSRPSAQVLPAISVATAISALPATALIYTLDRVLLPSHASHDLGALYVWVFVPMLLGSVFILYLIHWNFKGGRPIDTAGQSTPRQCEPLPSDGASGEPSLTDTPEAEPERQSLFLKRLSGQTDADLIYLKMNDHYVEAVTAAGSKIILMRFTDAVAELAGMGLQVHRSYWVSYRHLVRLTRDRHRRYLELAGAHKIPVSRTYISAVRLAAEGLAAGGKNHPQAWTSGATPDTGSAAAGAQESRQSPKDPAPAIPPQRQPTPEERAPTPNRLIHTAARHSTVAAPEKDPQTLPSQ